MIPVIIAVLGLFLGLFLQNRDGFPTEKATKWTNFYLLNIVLPALALLYIPQIKAEWGLLIPISAAWFTFITSWIIFGILGKLLHWDRGLTGCLIIVAGLANTSFLGFPIVEGLYGKEGMPIALLIDQGGSFLLVSSLSIIVGSLYSHKSGKLSSIPIKIISFPPFGFLMGTLVMSILGVPTPEFLMPLLKLIGRTMAPMALFAIGLKFSLDFDSLKSRYFWMGMGYRLILAPILVWLIYRNFLPQDSLTFKVTVLESAMAPMITGSIVAISFDLRPKLATLLAGLGIPIAGLSLLFWYYLLG
ncbi:AEC family transporter [Algoriphagus lutimaris]|uniref:AEC family transporter n=1 Tax=Algoriphagus lutimaris TaxID=613197 RepID=UPI00196A7A1C|nr:AEC family transporter [Algoriphagus lutimaris]MBN3521348.1 AEC family transporter [Algoriphagus lutimaris]